MGGSGRLYVKSCTDPSLLPRRILLHYHFPRILEHLEDPLYTQN